MGFKKGVIYLLTLCLFVSFVSIAFAATGFTNDQQLVFTGTSSSPGTLYQDAIGANLDVGIELCDEGPSKFVGGFYALNVSGSFLSSLVTYGSSTNALSAASTSAGGTCFTQSGAGFLTVSPSALSTPDPDVDKAAFPGKLWIGFSSSANPGGSIEGYQFADTNAQLSGSYSVSRSYDQSSGLVSVSTPSITFSTVSGSFSKGATDASYGVTSDRKLLIGVCTDEDGADCNDGAIVSSDVFPLSLDTGIVSPTDQITYDRNIVINGLDYDFCIGTNLETSMGAASPDPIYYSQTLTVSTTITNDLDSPFERNGGNVDVTTDFDILFTILNSTGSVVYSETRTITSTLVPDGSTPEVFTWDAFAKSGIYTARIVVDSDNEIVECNEGDNIDTDSFELKAITLPDIYIDGNLTSDFAHPNVPYNVTFFMKNSDNLTLPNASVSIVEVNGLNLLGPTQLYNRTTQSNASVKSGLVSNKSVSFRTNGTGGAEFILIPTYNPFYTGSYGFSDIDEYIGTYELYLAGEESDGETFIFIENGSTTPKYAFSITNTSYDGPLEQKSIDNTIVNQAMDFMYDTFVGFIRTILG